MSNLFLELKCRNEVKSLLVFNLKKPPFWNIIGRIKYYLNLEKFHEKIFCFNSKWNNNKV
jgi:hypothetical protein